MKKNAVILQGNNVTITPLLETHHDDLVDAIQDGELWKLWYTFIPPPAAMLENIQYRLSMQKAGTMLPFAVIDNQTQRAIGMTTYTRIDKPNRRVEIGGTWYRKSAQRTVVNTESKLLLLRHAFEIMNCIAVEFRTHALNRQSRQGIERIGAKLDGILRNQRLMPDGTLRDTCVYSIIASEWPTVKTHLFYLLGHYEPDHL